MALIFPYSVYPTKLSGEINFTNGNSHFKAAKEAIVVFPDPQTPSNRIECN